MDVTDITNDEELDNKMQLAKDALGAYDFNAFVVCAALVALHPELNNEFNLLFDALMSIEND